MKIGHTDFSEDALTEIREMTLREAMVKHPSVHKDVLATIAKPEEPEEMEEVEKPKKSKK
tara:strand:- start:177 stop:356 length:180 start_codon:yes stop_codon:yes gene_type:complete